MMVASTTAPSLTSRPYPSQVLTSPSQALLSQLVLLQKVAARQDGEGTRCGLFLRLSSLCHGGEGASTIR